MNINWTEIPHRLKKYPSKTTLLVAGKTANYFYVVQSGAVRMWFNKEGKDITLQFFFEGSPVCSFESFMRNSPSLFIIESIEPIEVIEIHKKDLLVYVNSNPSAKDIIMKYLFDRMIDYTHQLLFMQIYSPKERYAEILTNRPEILLRVQQQYIASYLGITPVSLSRIRSRK